MSQAYNPVQIKAFSLSLSIDNLQSKLFLKAKFWYSFVLVLLFNGLIYAQDSFQRGYFIDDTDGKVECLIKNLDWKNNPTKFSYKLNEDSSPRDATINHVQEFHITGKAKYKRFEVDIERSSEDLHRLGNEKNPKSNNETLFLNVRVEGGANLYSYSETNIKKFFYSIDDNKVQQLIYINYLDKDNNVLKNNRYRQQLWNYVKCENESKSDIDKIEYSERDLVKHFTNYNHCKGVNQVNYVNNESKDLFNLSIRPGIRYSSLELNNISEDSYADFGGHVGLRVGIEFEFILPYNNNKWSVLLEPTYTNYNSNEQETPLYESVSYQYLEIPLGVRHYIFLKSGSQVFVNAHMIYNATLNSSIKYAGGQEFELKSKPNYAFGMGFRIKNKYSFELRYNTPQDIQREDSSFWMDKNYKEVSAIFGYSLF